MNIKKITMQCAFFSILIFLAYSLGYLFLQPYGEFKGLLLLSGFFIFIFYFYKEIILLGLGAKKNYYKWSPKTRLYSSGFIRSEYIAFKPMGRLCLIFRDDLNLKRRKELHEEVLQNPSEAFSFYQLVVTSFFFLILKPTHSLANRLGFMRPYVFETLYYFLNPCIEFALGKKKEAKKNKKANANFCEEILCHSSLHEANTLMIRALKKSL